MRSTRVLYGGSNSPGKGKHEQHFAFRDLGHRIPKRGIKGSTREKKKDASRTEGRGE